MKLEQKEVEDIKKRLLKELLVCATNDARIWSMKMSLFELKRDVKGMLVDNIEKVRKLENENRRLKACISKQNQQDFFKVA